MTASLILQLRSVTIRVVDSPTLVTGEAPQSNKDVTQVVNTCLRPLPIRLSLLYRFAVSHYKQIIKVKRENSGLYSKTAKRRQGTERCFLPTETNPICCSRQPVQIEQFIDCRQGPGQSPLLCALHSTTITLAFSMLQPRLHLYSHQNWLESDQRVPVLRTGPAAAGDAGCSGGALLVSSPLTLLLRLTGGLRRFLTAP